MKIPQQQIEQFLLNIPATVKAILLFGPESTLISARKEKILTHHLSNELLLTRLCQTDINPSSLHEALGNISMFAGRKIILLENCSKLDPTSLELIANNNLNAIVIIASNDLPPSSALRKFCEANQAIATIGCYQDDDNQITNLIKQKLSEAQISVNQELVAYLIENLRNYDRLFILSELDKIITYCGDKKSISIKLIQDIFTYNYRDELEELGALFAQKKYNLSVTLIEKLELQSISRVTIIRNLLRYLMRLCQAKSSIQGGKTAEAAMMELQPPVFFNHKKSFLESLRKNTTDSLFAEICKLQEIELRCKTTIKGEKYNFYRLLINC